MSIPSPFEIYDFWTNEDDNLTHDSGCWKEHFSCAIHRLYNEIERLTLQVGRKDMENRNLRSKLDKIDL